MPLKKVVRKPVKQVLREIGKYLAIQDAKGEAVWDVLTALRGPDNESYPVKEATTAVIRWHLVGDMSGAGLDSNPDSEQLLEIRKELKGNHFKSHVYNAFTALGLEWGEVNK
jgi:hypothetical protein